MRYSRLLSRLLPLVALALLGSSAFAASKSASDNFTGQDSRGPFILSYQPVEANSETVYLDGLHQSRNRDYMIDYESGVLAFNSSIRSGQKVLISYRCDASAKSRTGSMTSMSLNLLSGGSSSMKLTMDQKMVGNGNLQVSGLGLTSNVGTGSKTFATMFKVDPNSKNAQGKSDPLSVRSGLKFGGTYGVGGLKLSGNFMRIGEKFQDAASFGAAAGTSATGLTGEWSPIAGLNFSASNSRNEILAGKDKGKVDTVDVQKLSYDYTKGGALNLVRQTNQTDLGGGKGTTTSVNQLGLTNKLMKFTMSDENRTSKGVGDGDQVNTRRYDLSTALSSKMNFTTNRTITDSRNNGDAVAQAFGLTTKLDPKSNLVLGFVTNDADKTGKDSKSTLNYTNAILAFTAERSGKTTSADDVATNVFGLNAKINPKSSIILGFLQGDSKVAGASSKGNMTFKTTGLTVVSDHSEAATGKNGAQSLTNVDIKAGAAPLSVSAVLNQNDQEKAADTQHTNVAINSATKLGTFNTSVDRTQVEQTGTTTDARFGMNLKLSTVGLDTKFGQKQIENTGTETNVNLGVGALGNRLKLVASLVQNDYVAKDDLNQTQYGMEIRPWNPLRLQASVLQQQSGKSVGDGFHAEMELRLGGPKVATQQTAPLTEIFNTGIDLKPGERLALAGSFTQSATDDLVTAKETMVRTKAMPLDYLTLSGFYKNREKASAKDQETLVAAMNLAPIKTFQLTGNYETNPEDKDSKVSPITRRLVGIKTTLGSVGLSGKYGSTQDLGTGQIAQTRQYGLDLKLWRSTQLSAGLTQDDPLNGPTQNTYTLKVQRSLGDDFSLALEGKMIAKQQAGPQDQSDISANLQLGTKF